MVEMQGPSFSVNLRPCAGKFEKVFRDSAWPLGRLIVLIFCLRSLKSGIGSGQTLGLLDERQQNCAFVYMQTNSSI